MRNKMLSLVFFALMFTSSWAVAVEKLPPTEMVDLGEVEDFCPEIAPVQWRKAQTIEGVDIQESRLCLPDNPAEVAAFVKGTNNISMATLMDTGLAADAVIKTNDIDGDGDPDHIIIKLEVMELNGRSPDFEGVVPTFDIAPGVQPGFWVFTPKTRGMSTKSFVSIEANSLLRVPSPTIRVEQDDIVWLVLENTHYLPHSIHLHGVDHPFMDHSGMGNDGVGQTSAMDIMPGESKVYVIKPRQPGTQYYHCHVQPHTHIPMGLQGLFVVEENRPNNWLQTFNVGNGQVRYPSVAVKEKYDQEYDLHFQSAGKELHSIVQSANDPRLIARKLNQEFNITQADDSYFMINGRSFPYTLRESLIVMEPDQKVKLRVLNGHTEALALHLHGHKPTATHYDGVDNGPAARITRDVHTMVPAQRLDLELSGVNDGLHSFGEGVWMFHDHVEKSFTTNGIGEGGGLGLVVYKNFIDANGTPEVHGMSLEPYFSKKFWKGEIPIWQNFDEWGSLGAPASSEGPVTSETDGGGGAGGRTVSAMDRFLAGLFLGIAVYLLIHYRRQLQSLVSGLRNLRAGSH